MEKEKILEIVNEINKIARLNCMYNKIEEIGEKYDEFVEANLSLILYACIVAGKESDQRSGYTE